MKSTIFNNKNIQSFLIPIEGKGAIKYAALKDWLNYTADKVKKIISIEEDSRSEHFKVVYEINSIPLVDELTKATADIYEDYLDECDLDEDRGVDAEDFARHAKETIEKVYGTDMFDAYNIESYASDYADARADSGDFVDADAE